MCALITVPAADADAVTVFMFIRVFHGLILRSRSLSIGPYVSFAPPPAAFCYFGDP